MFRKFKEKKIRDKRGFTLIEVITVLLIISLGMVGVLSLISQNIRSQSLNKNTLIAYQLAQEGVELIRQVRDTNWREGVDWQTDLNAGTYYMDYQDRTPHLALSASYGNLGSDSDGMYYSTPGSAAAGSGFSRLIRITEDATDPKILITVSIYWSDRGRNFSYDLEAELYDWK